MKSNFVQKTVGASHSMGIAKQFLKQVSKKEKSVRTTFTLSGEGAEALTWIIKNRPTKIKSIIDTLCSQFQNSLKNENDENIITIIIDLAKEHHNVNKRDIRKSMVLSADSQKILNDVAKKNQIPRDAILDRSFIFMATLLKYSSEERLKQHNKALKIINKLCNTVEKIEKELIASLDEEDPILRRLGTVAIISDNLRIAIREELKNGTPINPEEF